MNKQKYFLLGVVLTFSNMFLPIAFSEEDSISENKKIIWSCQEYYLGTENVLWLVEWGSKSYIKVFNERIPARHTMEGLEKRWDWDLNSNDSTYNYAMVLGLDKEASYYNLKSSKDGTAKPRELYKCEKDRFTSH